MALSSGHVEIDCLTRNKYWSVADNALDTTCCGSSSSPQICVMVEYPHASPRSRVAGDLPPSGSQLTGVLELLLGGRVAATRAPNRCCPWECFAELIGLLGLCRVRALRRRWRLPAGCRGPRTRTSPRGFEVHRRDNNVATRRLERSGPRVAVTARALASRRATRPRRPRPRGYHRRRQPHPDPGREPGPRT